MNKEYELNKAVMLKTGRALDEHLCDYLAADVQFEFGGEHLRFMPARIPNLVQLALSKTKQVPSIIKNDNQKTK